MKQAIRVIPFCTDNELPVQIYQIYKFLFQREISKEHHFTSRFFVYLEFCVGQTHLSPATRNDTSSYTGLNN